MDAKKKNRKKKGNKNKATEDVASTANSEATSIQDNGNSYGLEDNCPTKSLQDPDSSSTLMDNHSANNSIRSDIQSIGASESDMDQDKHRTDETNNMYIQEEVRRLKDEGNIWQQKQVGLEDKVEILVKELSTCAQKGTILEEKLNFVLNGNDLLLQKQALLEDKVNIIDDVRESVNTKEISLKEMISKVEESNLALQLQVKELEGSRNSTFEENQRLLEKITLLESKIEILEKDLSSHSETLMQKLMKLGSENNTNTIHISGEDAVVNELATENAAATTGKLDEPYIRTRDLDTTANSSASELNHIKKQDETSAHNNYIPHRDEKTLDVDRKILQVKGELSTVNESASETALLKSSSGVDGSRTSEEILTVPLDEIEIHEDEPLELLSDDSSNVPFSDAPLIGAPFRLISFVTRYVSGADLVNGNDSKSGR